VVKTSILQLIIIYYVVCMRIKKRKPYWQVRIANDRINILFSLAKKMYRKYPDRSKRYVQLARKIGLRYNIRLRKKQKKLFCKKCNSFLVYGYSASVRLDSKNKTLIIKCLNCKNIYRSPYK
jgi:ribonuclease P protein subunit RPR2